jgi:hypothetical protein
MSNVARQFPFFEINFTSHSGLQAQGADPWVCHATAKLRLVLGTGTRRRQSKPLPMRLDTGAFVSLLPEEWLVNFQLQSFLQPGSTRIPFQTAAGVGEGRLAPDASAVFVNDPGAEVICFDCLVTPNLNGRGYGLLCLKDVINHFFILAEGRLEFGEDGQPLELPDLVLVPRHVWDRVQYFCPKCRVVAQGLSGLHLICGDCNLPLVTA